MSDNNINVTAPLHASTKQGKLTAAREVFMDGDKETLQQIGDKTHQLENAIKDITATGGASTANAVSYSNEASGMTAVTVQGAIDELVAKNKSQDTTIEAKAEKSDVQAAVSELKGKDSALFAELVKKADNSDVTSKIIKESNRVNSELAKKANAEDVSSQMRTEQERVNTELAKKFDKESILQESGEAEDKVMSQKAVSTKFSDLSKVPIQEIILFPFTKTINKDVQFLRVIENDVYQILQNGYRINLEFNSTFAINEIYINTKKNGSIFNFSIPISPNRIENGIYYYSCNNFDFDDNYTDYCKIIVQISVSIQDGKSQSFTCTNFSFNKEYVTLSQAINENKQAINENNIFSLKQKNIINPYIEEYTNSQTNFYLFEQDVFQYMKNNKTFEFNTDIDNISLYINTKKNGKTNNFSIPIHSYKDNKGTRYYKITEFPFEDSFEEFYKVILLATFTASKEESKRFECTRFSYEEVISLSQAIIENKQAINLSQLDYNQMKHIIVRKDGKGDFTSIMEAINSIDDASVTNQYDIQVYDDYEIKDLTELYRLDYTKNTKSNGLGGYCALLITKPYIHVRGVGKRITLSIVSPLDLPGKDFQYVQTVYQKGNSILSNLYIKIKGGRYGIHIESNGDKNDMDYHSTIVMNNVIVEHLGNAAYENGSTWKTCCAEACGLNSGMQMILKDCIWKSVHTQPFYIHGNSNLDAPTSIMFERCSIASLSKDYILGKKQCYIGDLGSNQPCNVTLVGCNIADFNLYAFGNTRGLEKERDNDDIRIGGVFLHGNSNRKMLISSRTGGYYISHKEKGVHNINIKGGTAYEAFWGADYKDLKGTENSKASVISIRKITELNKSWGNESTNVYSLAYRLGNCKATNKTLIIEVDGVEHTLIFDKNYMTEDGSSYTIYDTPFMSLSDIISDIRTKLSEWNLYYGNVWEPEYKYFEDEEDIMFNSGQTMVNQGKFVVKSGSIINEWRLASNTDFMNIAFVAEKINPDEFGRVIYVNNAYIPHEGEIGAFYNCSNGNLVECEEVNALFKQISQYAVEFIR